MHAALLVIARDWIKSASTRPAGDAFGQAELRRATSNAYYALFHALAQLAADLLAEPGTREWTRVYRALEHGTCKQACEKLVKGGGLTQSLRDVANSFITLQDARHAADYDPDWTTDRWDVFAHVAAAGQAIDRLQAAAMSDRRAFILHLLFRERR